VSLCCQQDDRRDAVRRMNGRNGFDYVEVADTQQTLTAYFLGKMPPEFQPNAPARASHLAIDGGRRVTGIKITGVTPVIDPDPEKDDSLVITLDKYGDFSTYTLRLVNVENIDPCYESVEFSFKVNCPSDLDCAPVSACEPSVIPEPEINYLAKDYGSFRQLILDRLAVLMPEWQETHAADLGIALVEMLAYTGDYLSYYQDAVATEAYLETARQRISVRRLVRLVDYFLHEGCNARTFVAIETDSNVQLPAGTAFITGFNAALAEQRTILTLNDLVPVPSVDYEVFEPIDRGAIPIRADHSRILFYTWGEKECCLERGATSATLLDGWGGDGRKLQLAVGDILIFEEVIGPRTGLAADADPARRQAIRIRKITTGEDPVFPDANGRPTPYIDIEWAQEDALQFPFCISVIGPAPACLYLSEVSIACGNVILVDHGQTQPREDLCTVPTLTTTASCECTGEPSDVKVTPGRIRPTLKKTPLTYRAALLMDTAPAASLLTQDVRSALPQLWLTSQPPSPWSVRYDLIESQPGDWQFVVEIDDDGYAHLRFGDGTLGVQPPAGMSLTATYRIGNGSVGNVGAEAISRLVVPSPLSGAVITVRNPLPASGGTDAEPMAEAKLYAPHLFRQEIERAITSDDYETIAERNPKIQLASAALNWTGSWYEADVAVDPLASETPSPTLIEQIECYLERYRRMGHDLEVTPAIYVPIDLELEICALPNYERAHVKRALLDVFSTRLLPDSTKGFFHPDKLTFGGGIYLSRIIAVAQAVTGVESVTVTKFQRLFASPNFEIENGILPLAHAEIAELGNDPNYPEHGKLVIRVLGGR
jgi:hypothetical protein